MKKLSKLTALLLSLLMIVSLFAACGEDKKSDEKEDETTSSESKEKKLKGEELLLGDWDAEFVNTSSDLYGLSIVSTLTFKEDGTIEGYVSRDTYDVYIEQSLEKAMALYTEEDLEEYGIETFAELKELLREYMAEEMSYEILAADFKDYGTWELDGDTLTIIRNSEDEESEPKVIETELSKGVDTFEYSGDDVEISFKKNYKGNTDKNNNKDNTKEDDKLTGEALLLGEWKMSYDYDIYTYDVIFTFNKNGTFDTYYPEENYERLIEQTVENTTKEYSEEELLEEGFSSIEEFEESLREEIPYEDVADALSWTGTWELNGDDLTLEFDQGTTLNIETKLSDNKTTFTTETQNGLTWHFEKIR